MKQRSGDVNADGEKRDIRQHHMQIIKLNGEGRVTRGDDLRRGDKAKDFKPETPGGISGPAEQGDGEQEQREGDMHQRKKAGPLPSLRKYPRRRPDHQADNHQHSG